MKFPDYLKKNAGVIEKALSSYLPAEKEHPQQLHQAMRYSVLLGGKRVRPVLTLAACEAVGGSKKKVMSAACALELLHNYSLVHDDLPCMDDDDIRRGQPTCHVKFGEEVAVLAGDALLTLAFQLLSGKNEKLSPKDSQRRLLAMTWIAEAVGTYGMVGGQAVDIEWQGKEMDLPTVEYINTHKTGALIAVSLKIGAFLGGGSSKQVEALERYGRYLGLLFQIVDDILDGEGYAKVIGVSQAKKEAENLTAQAIRQLHPFGPKGRILEEIARFVLTRDH